MVPIDNRQGKQTMAEVFNHFCLTDMKASKKAGYVSAGLNAKDQRRAVQLVNSRRHEHFSFWSVLEAVASEVGCQPRELEALVKSARPDMSEVATSMRGTAMCRAWMSEVLQTDVSDLSDDTVHRVLMHPDTPAKDPRTWRSWCTTGGPKQPKARKAFPGIHARWFDAPELGLPVQRHLAALQVLADGEVDAGDRLAAHRQNIDRLLNACHQVWSPFTTGALLPVGSAWHGDLQFGTGWFHSMNFFKYASPKDEVRVLAGQVSPCTYASSLGVRDLYGRQDRFSLIPFLLAFACERPDMPSCLRRAWSLELATLVALAGSEVGAVACGAPSSHLGTMARLTMILRLFLWGSADYQREVLSLGVPMQLAGLATEEAWRSCLAQWRSVYFDELVGLGVSADDLVLVGGAVDTRASGQVAVTVAQLLADMDGHRR